MSEYKQEPDQYEDTIPYQEDPEELEGVTAALSSFFLYRRAAHQNLTHRRRNSFYSLPREHQALLVEPPISHLHVLDRIDEAIERNAMFSEAIFRSAAAAFGIDLNNKSSWQHSASNEDLDKVRSTIKQFYRDWSVEGKPERDACYSPIMEELESRFGGMGDDKHKIRVLIPGAGLGRLAFDIAVAGFSSQGNEFSYHQLMASNYILNHTTQANELTIHPFIGTFSNHPSRTAHLRSVTIPDVHPATLLNSALADSVNDRFSMSAGDFRSSYNNAGSREKFDVCATVFFIDTAPNVIVYLKTIHNLLAPGGVWINFGPLLWHFEDHHEGGTRGNNNNNNNNNNKQARRNSDVNDEDLEAVGGSGSFELCLDEILVLVEKCGFKIEKIRNGCHTSYAGDENSMLKHQYEGAFWVAVKV